MTRAKSSTAYGTDMLEISFMAADRFPRVIPFGDKRVAMSWRLGFYSFRAALKREGDSRFATVAPLQVRIDESGNAVIEHVDTSEATRMVLAALRDSPLVTNPTQASTELREAPPLVEHTIGPIGMDAVTEWLKGGK